MIFVNLDGKSIAVKMSLYIIIIKLSSIHTEENMMETLPPATTLDRKWNEIWMDVWTHPGEEVFRNLLKERDHRATRGFIWMAVSSLILAVATGIGYIPVYHRLATQLGTTQNTGLLFGGAVFTNLICSIILVPISAIIGLAISSGIYHLISKLFRGDGNYGDLIFSMAAVAAPASLISGIMTIPVILFTNFPAIWWMFAILVGILSVSLGIYVIVMNINAVRGVENIGTWQAVLTIFLPVIVVVVLTFCCLALTVPAFINSVRG